MTIYEPFAVIDVPFPFADSARQKSRPALVLSSSEFQRVNGSVILTMITSAERGAWKFDIPLADWGKAGLRKPCVIRWKLFTLDGALVRGRRGHLSDRDRDAAGQSFAAIFPLAKR